MNNDMFLSNEPEDAPPASTPGNTAGSDYRLGGRVGGVAPFWGSADLPEKLSRDIGYRSDSIVLLRDLGPLSLYLRVPAPPTKIQNPSEVQNTPQNTPRILSRNQNTEEIQNKLRKPRIFVYFPYFGSWPSLCYGAIFYTPLPPPRLNISF